MTSSSRTLPSTRRWYAISPAAFLAQQRNAVLVGGTGTGKTHLAIAVARSCIRGGARGRFYNIVDLVNRLETETRNGRQGRLAEYLTRMDFIVLEDDYNAFHQDRYGEHVFPLQIAVLLSEPGEVSKAASSC